MRPIALHLENFGPFKNETIEFSKFYDSPLFLISGKTGAGKTTIFDGMTYALFGETTGKIRDGKEMRSNFATKDELTVVKFTFSHQNLFYEVERQPEQLVAKRTGDGLTSRAARVNLRILAQDGSELKEYKKAGEVRTFLEELLHLNAHQFTQIVLLPQGDFRKFLNANSDEKEVVLRQLFKTTLYRQLAEKIKEQRKAYQGKSKEDQAQIDFLLKQASWSADFESEVAELTGVEEKLALLVKQNAEFEKELSQEKSTLKLKGQAQTEAEKKLGELQNLAKLFQEQTSLTAKLAALAEEKSQIQLKEERLALLEWVAEQKATISRYEESQLNLTKISAALAQSEQAQLELQERLTTVTKAHALLQEESPSQENKNRQAEILEQLKPLVTEKTEVAHQLNIIQQEMKLMGLELREQEQNVIDLTQWQQKQRELGKLAAVKITAEANLKAYQERLNLWLEHLDSASDLANEISTNQGEQVKHGEKITQVKAALVKAQGDLKTKKSTSARLQIARLSMDLAVGEACPVCGATEHPQPHQEQSWTPELIKKAEAELEQAEINLAKLGQEEVKLSSGQDYLIATATKLSQQLAQEKNWLASHIKLETKAWESLLEAANWSGLAEVISSELSEVKEKISRLVAEIKQAQAAEVEAEETLVKINELSQSVEVLRTTTNSKAQAEIKLEASLTQLQKQVPEKWTDVASLATAISQLRTEFKAWQEQLQEQEESLQSLQSEQLIKTTQHQHYLQEKEAEGQRLKNLADTLAATTAASPYDLSQAEVVELLSQTSELPLLKASIKEFTATLQNFEVQLTQVKNKIGTASEPELAPAELTLTTLKNESAELNRQVIQKEERLKANQVLAKQVEIQQGALLEHWQALAELNQLSEVANGDGPHSKTSLERYVLQAYFEEILAVANSRLHQLTRNRYSFELSEQEGSYKNQTGLEINIFDYNVGSVRSVNTLSGGESFIAALALSLSLGEVVQAQAGGVQIDAMFIDEGFGALDEDALEMAIEALESIDGQGRMIGIISHVRELKQRIPQQLKVLASDTGTSRIDYQTELE